MAKPLVIVESPAKARKIAEYLGRDYVVEASIGHVRDLPREAKEIPPAYKSEPWARLGVNTDDDFKPLYIVPADKKEQVRKLKGLLKDADALLLATDEDREGESISWHLLEVLSPKVPVRRMVFHEITKKAIDQAVNNPRDIDMPLVDAQETRRILDRLFGYEVSPVLWKKVAPRLSAGRVQSVATRIVVERERERMAFRAASYWGVDATLEGGGQPFPAALVQVDGQRVATGRDFDSRGVPRAGVVVLDEPAAGQIAASLSGATVEVRSVEEKPYRSSPKPPFITSTLQQEAGRKLRYTARRTMQVAQRLYESGYITYMRTDSVALSDEAVRAARSAAERLYGPDHVPAQARRYASRAKNAQEAHEAIRPTGEAFRSPEEIGAEVGAEEAALYDLIWKRTVASQMADATGQSVSARLGARLGGRDLELSASGRTITFFGYLRAYVEGTDDPDAELDDRQSVLPPLAVGATAAVADVAPAAHATQAPARYTEASLVGRLEELGVGRPSTFASIISTIQERGYVWKKGSALVPTWTAFAVVGLLERYFPELVDYAFTAKLEDDLDLIASRQAERVPWLSAFYFGSNGDRGLKHQVAERLDEIDPRAVNSIPVGDGYVVRVGRYGPYLTREGSDERASLPDELCPDELNPERAAELLAAGQMADEPIGEDPETGLPVYVKSGRFGAYVQLGEAEEGSKDKPRRASLFKDMKPSDVDLDTALRLLSLPRTLGADPATGDEVVALNGRFGPYVKRGSESRSLSSEQQLFTVTLDEALALLAAPKYGRGRAATPPLLELGPDPVTGKPMVVKNGRFGVYLTDGETNVTVKEGWEELDPARAAELLADKRAAGPSKRPARKAAKKAPTKKAAKKPSTGKAAAGDGGVAGGDPPVAKPRKSVAKKATKAAGEKAPADGDGEEASPPAAERPAPDEDLG